MPSPGAVLALTLLVLALAPLPLAATPRSRAPAPPAAGPDAALLRMTDEITAKVSALRGLAVRRPIKRGVLSREAIRAHMERRLAEEFSKAEVAAEARVFERLGLLPRGVDYAQLVLDLLTEQVAGFYDPEAGELYVADWLPPEAQAPAMAHELTHALQDQHFDLRRFVKPLKDDGDRQLARAALVEGDGMAAMLEWQTGADVAALPDLLFSQWLWGALGAGSGRLGQAPMLLRETLLFPYVAGLRFVREARKLHPWSRIDRMYAAAPESTEQILHPEKYQAGERPVAIAVTPLPSLGRPELRRDTLGELQLAVLLKAHLAAIRAADPRAPAPERPDEAAAGWAGDRLVAYGAESGPVAVVHVSAWDSEADAAEWLDALTPVLAHLAGRSADAGRRYVDVAGDAFAAERRGARVVALFGVPAPVEAQVRAEALRGWTSGPAAPPASLAPVPAGAPPAGAAPAQGAGAGAPR